MRFFHALSVLGLTAALAPPAAAQPAPPFDADGDSVADSIRVATNTVEVVSGATGNVIRTLSGDQPAENFAAAALLVPDLNGDACAEVLVGAPAYLVNEVERGAIYVFSGTTGTRLWLTLGPQDSGWTFCCDVLAHVPDQDLDGVPEILARLSTTSPTPYGQTLLLSGETGQTLAVRAGTVGGLAAWARGGGLLYSPADIDDSGVVDSIDLHLYIDWFIEDNLLADFNHDGLVDIQDLDEMLSAYDRALTTVVALAIPPGEGGGGGGNPENTGSGCAPTNVEICPAASVEIFGCDADDWVWGGVYVLHAIGTPPGGTYTWDYTTPDITILQAIGNGVTFQITGQPTGQNAMIRVRYTPPGQTCSVFACCSRPYTCPCNATLEITDLDAPVIVLPENALVCNDQNTLPEPIVVGVGQAVAITVAGQPPIGTYGWRIVTTDPVNWPAEILPLGLFNERALITPAGAEPGQVLVEVGYAPFGCCPTTCRILIQWSPDTDGDGLADFFEFENDCPNLNDPDSDNDGFSDGDEVRFGSDPCDFDSRPTHSTDSDRDGLRDSEERQEFNTDYQTFDTDDDGVQDFAEVKLGFNPRDRESDTLTLDGERPEFLAHDRDRDAIFDEHELARGLDPLNPDQDRDGIRDGLELRRGLDPQLADQGPGWPGPWVDFDADGLSDAVEGRLGTSPLTADTDGDGVSDGNEARMGLNPNREDSDYDGMPDGREDWDGDGMSNRDEELVGLDPASTDSDGDGICDPVDMREHSEDDQMCAANAGCWTPPFVTCEGGVCPVLRITLRSMPGSPGPIFVNGEAYELGGSPNGILVPVGYDQDVVVAFSCPGWPYHDGLGFGYLCRDENGNESFFADESLSYEKVTLVSTCDGVSDGTIGGYYRARTPASPGAPGCEGSGNQGPPRIDVHIDSDNNDGFNPPLGGGNNNQNSCDAENDDENEIEDCATLPGKILLASTWDSDGDNIPDYADGYNLLTDASGLDPHKLDDPNHRGYDLIPVRVDIRGVANLAGAYLQVTYDANHPKNDVGHTAGDLFTLNTGTAAAPKNLRLWAPRKPTGSTEHQTTPPTRDLMQGGPHGVGTFGPLDGSGMPGTGGDPCPPPRTQLEPPSGEMNGGLQYVVSGEDMALDTLVGAERGQVMMYIQAVGASPALAQRLTFTLVGAACDQPADCTDAVRVTAVDRRMVAVNSDGTLGEERLLFAPTSQPTPVLTLDVTPESVVATNIRPDPSNTSRLLADLVVTGTVHDAACDLIPGTEGEIPHLAVLVNHEVVLGTMGGPVLVPVTTVEKLTGEEAANPQPLLQPYRYEGAFDTTSVLVGVPVDEGYNTLQLTATNAHGFSGFAQVAFEVTAAPPPDEIVEYLIDLGDPPATGVFNSVVTYARRRYLATEPPGLWDTHYLVPGEFPDEFTDGAVTLRFVLPENFTLDSGTINSLETVIRDSAVAGGVARLQWVEETGVDTREFGASEALDPESRGSFEGYTLSQAGNVGTRGSEGGSIRPVVEEWLGPAQVLDHIEVAEGETIRPLKKIGPRYVLAKPNGLTGRVLLAIWRINRAMAPPHIRRLLDKAIPPSELAGVESPAEMLQYYEGMGKGLFVDTPIGLVEGLGGVAELGWRGLSYVSPVVREWRMRFEGRDCFVKDAEQWKATFDTGRDLILTAGRVELQLILLGARYKAAAETGNEAELNAVGEEMRRYAEEATTLLELGAGIIEALPEEKRGRVMGRIAGEITIAVAPGGVIANAALKTSRIATMAPKLRQIIQTLDFITPTEQADLLALIERYAQLGTRLRTYGPLAQKVEGLYAKRRELNAGEDCWESFQLIMLNVREQQQVFKNYPRGAIREAAERAARDAFNEGKAPTVQQLKDLLRHRNANEPGGFQAGFLGDAELDGHHVIPKVECLREMIARKRYGERFEDLTSVQKADVTGEFERIKDLMPGFPMDRALHREFHGILKGTLNPSDSPTDVDGYANKVREALQELQRRHPGDGSFDYETLAREADRWLRTPDIGLLPPL